ncbi:hypothetical protein B0J13DRAFT_613508 [Dactylonectria estremocensis]|uniref:NWD NACHT-NTPase N-terminal domain-containing protein n=1 Tax=Dactylonectria estremocensis TaxID=1079267 RepID=A0A9P9ID41_9HYPO|nr:hypothetical protein B0J13DRAFT_613508 [Dactylonectria estremocensis]
MARRWFEKVEAKVKKRRPAAPHQSALAPSPPTSQPTPSPPTSTDSDTSPLLTLQERLWNQAYDELKLVQEGLDRTQKQASIKRGIDEGLQAVQAVRGIVDKAVHAAPEAAVAWLIDPFEPRHRGTRQSQRHRLRPVENGVVLELSIPASRREQGRAIFRGTASPTGDARRAAL